MLLLGNTCCHMLRIFLWGSSTWYWLVEFFSLFSCSVRCFFCAVGCYIPHTQNYMHTRLQMWLPLKFRLVWLVCTDASQKPALSCQLRTWSMLRTRNNTKSHNPNGTRCLHHAKEWSREHLSLSDLDYKLVQPIDGVWQSAKCNVPTPLFWAWSHQQ